MSPRLKADLRRCEQLPFDRATDREVALRAFHSLTAKQRLHPAFARLEEIREWLFAPLTLWPIDFAGVIIHVVKTIRKGKELDSKTALLMDFVPPLPNDKVVAAIIDHEQAVKLGSYESLVEARHKFDSVQADRDATALSEDWLRIKRRFDVRRFQNNRGIIRRSMVQERNFRPREWKFAWKSEKEKFQRIFDAFCHKWLLYGMEMDNPLVQKLSVNLTPFGTMIFIPKYWSFDRKRDLNWRNIAKLHRTRGVSRQGEKLRWNKIQRDREARRAIFARAEGRRKGLRGDALNQWVKSQLGMRQETDDRQLRRLYAYGASRIVRANASRS